VELGNQLRVEVFGNGGWWKDSDGRSGQVAVGQARKGALAAVAMVANQFGMDGWALIDVVSQARGAYHLSFELAYVMEDDDDQQPDLPLSQ
jgi:hypothetical protein